MGSLVPHFLAKSSYSSTLSPTEQQFRQLLFVERLWSVIQDVFPTSWLESPAELILAAVLRQKFHVSDANIRCAWNNLCFDLITACSPANLVSICMQNTQQSEIEVKRKVWCALAQSWTPSTEELQKAVSFLATPIECVGCYSCFFNKKKSLLHSVWAMSKYEFERWDEVLQCAYRQAGTESGVFIERLIRQLGDDKLRQKVPPPTSSTLHSLTSFVTIDSQNWRCESFPLWTERTFRFKLVG